MAGLAVRPVSVWDLLVIRAPPPADVFLQSVHFGLVNTDSDQSANLDQEVKTDIERKKKTKRKEGKEEKNIRVMLCNVVDADVVVLDIMSRQRLQTL